MVISNSDKHYLCAFFSLRSDTCGYQCFFFVVVNYWINYVYRFEYFVFQLNSCPFSITCEYVNNNKNKNPVCECLKQDACFITYEPVLLQQLNEPLVESSTILQWETQEGNKQRAAWSRPACLGGIGVGGSFGKRSRGRLPWSMGWWAVLCH